MKNLKTILFIMILSTFFIVDNTFSAWGIEDINQGLIGDNNTVDITIQSYIDILFGFLYLAAVLYGLYGGYNIFTAGDDDEKVKTGKTIIIQSLIGVAIIFLAGPIVDLFLGESGNDGIFTE